MTHKYVRIEKLSIDDTPDGCVLRGVLDLSTMRALKVDNSYQRERLSPSARKEITKALENRKSLPDIELGMRGDSFDMPNNDEGLLQDAVYIIDGYQRISSITEHLERFPGDNVRLGVVVRLKTNPVYERERFQALNLFRAKMSPSLLLRNYKEDNHLIAQLYGLSKNTKEVLYGRVCWSQSMAQGEMISALTYCQVALLLHSHLGSFADVSTKEIPGALLRLEKITGLPLFRGNIQGFWEFIDAAWGVRSVSRRGTAVHLKSQFLRTLTRLFADHTDFWQGNRLAVPAEIRKKLSRLALLSDPEIIRLASSGGRAGESLYFNLVQYINSGKRTKRMTSRYGAVTPVHPIMDDDDEAEHVG